MDTTSVQSLNATPITSPPLINQSSAILKPHGDGLPIALHHKKCIHHRAINCGSNAGNPHQPCMQHMNARQIRISTGPNGNVVQRTTGSLSSVQPCPSSGSVTSVIAASAANAAAAATAIPTSSSSSSSSSSTGGSSSSNGPIAIQSQAGLAHLISATLLADRYLLMDMVDGSTLYKCVDLKSHEELVCKVANNPCSNLLTAHFRLDGHNHVNSLYKVIQGSNQTYLFFSPSQGDLHSYVRVRKRLREPEARRLFRQMCEVVKCCHEQGIVLRDLKLRKFVFADAERTHLRLETLEDAVVLDNPAEDLLQDKRGCPAYVSPEILKANTTYSGKAADMWSLGVILYTMLVGRYPFNDSEHASLFAKISRGQFLVPDCLTSKARCMIRSLLRREPDERITSDDILLHPWMTQDDSRDYTKSPGDQCVPDIDDDDSA